MSTGTRRLNYTRRIRIKREHAVISLPPVEGGNPPTFNAQLQLADYKLPPEAKVFVEAHRQTAFQRFDFGTVASAEIPENRVLSNFGEGEGVRFRVKVVAANQETIGSVAAARILAQADDITPDQEGRRRSLLALDPADFRDEIWRLEIDENTGPLVRVSSHLVRDRHGLARSHEFISLVLPDILRRVLIEALQDGLPDSDDDWNTWQGKWVRMACGVLAKREPPETIADDPDERERWVEKVVECFSRRHGLAKAFGAWWTEGAQA